MKHIYEHILDNATLLLAEDDAALRKKFAKMLRLYVQEVYEASNGDEAYDIYMAKQPNIIISDVKMPLTDGLFLTKMIRKHNEKIPIVAISAYSDKETLIDFIPLKLEGYLIKPIETNQLESILYQCAKKLHCEAVFEQTIAPGWCYSFAKKALLHNQTLISLAPKETLFLELLLKHKNSVVSKTLIESELYFGEGMSDSALSNLVSKVRKKLPTPKTLQTVSSQGFMLHTEC